MAVAPVAYPVGKAVAIRPQVCLAEPCGQRGHRPTSGRLRSLRQLPPFFEANPPLEEHPAAGGAEEREHLLRKDILYLKKGQAAKRHGKKAREKDRVHVSARTLPRTVKQYGHQTESGTQKKKCMVQGTTHLIARPLTALGSPIRRCHSRTVRGRRKSRVIGQVEWGRQGER